MFHPRPAASRYRLLNILVFALTASLSFAFGQEGVLAATADPPEDLPPASCPVTLPLETSFQPPVLRASGLAIDFGMMGRDEMAASGSERLGTILPVDGVWRAWSMPAQPGDFAYDNKLPWFRSHPAFSVKDGPLTITGKRLDGPAPSFVETFQVGGFAREADNIGYMGGISIPAFGCWEITGHYAADELRFVVWVVPPPAEPLPSGTTLPNVNRMTARPTATHRIQVDGEVGAKQLVYRVIPEVPHEAKVADISGTIVLHAIIGASGRVTQARYVSGPPLLAQAAIDAVRWSQYRVTGENVEVETDIQVEFPPANN
jgi:hypothetical protein